MTAVGAWMPIYWGDYAKDTGHLGAVHHGAYLMLIKHYWVTGRRLPADDNQLWRIACADSLAHWRKIKAVVLAFFEEKDGFLYHRRIDRELQDAESNAERRISLARHAAAMRWGKEPGSHPEGRPPSKRNARRNAQRMPEALPRECPPPSPKESSSSEISTDAVREAQRAESARLAHDPLLNQRLHGLAKAMKLSNA